MSEKIRTVEVRGIVEVHKPGKCWCARPDGAEAHIHFPGNEKVFNLADLAGREVEIVSFTELPPKVKVLGLVRPEELGWKHED